METRVTRYSFFRDKHAFTRFDEHSPPLCVAEVPHAICDCTRSVEDRPAGEPESVSQIIDFVETIGPYKMRLEMTIAHHGHGIASEETIADLRRDDNLIKFWIHWPRKEGVPAPSKMIHGLREDEHAYFWFLRPDHLKVDVTGTGDHDDLDCTLGNVLFGNAVDVSTFFNGHSPSRVVDLSKIAPDDVWVHHCTIGDEAQAKLEDGREAACWREFKRHADLIRSLIAPINAIDVGVDEVRERASVPAEQAIASCFAYLEAVLYGFQGSALRKAMAKVDAEATEKMLARVRAS